MERFEYPITVHTFTIEWHDCALSKEGPHRPCQFVAGQKSLEEAITFLPPKATGYVNRADDTSWVVSPTPKAGGCREVVQYNPDGTEIVSDDCNL